MQVALITLGVLVLLGGLSWFGLIVFKTLRDVLGDENSKGLM